MHLIRLRHIRTQHRTGHRIVHDLGFLCSFLSSPSTHPARLYLIQRTLHAHSFTLTTSALRPRALLACIDTATLAFTHTCPSNHYWCPPPSLTVQVRRTFSLYLRVLIRQILLSSPVLAELSHLRSTSLVLIQRVQPC